MESSKSLFEQLGGQPALDKANEILFARCLSDPELVDYFEATQIDRVMLHIKYVLIAALGGPNNYTGRPVRSVHQKHKVQDRHFDLLIYHVRGTLDELGVDQKLNQSVVNVVESVRNEVLNK